jgi:hypothetical protein
MVNGKYNDINVSGVSTIFVVVRIVNKECFSWQLSISDVLAAFISTRDSNTVTAPF